jgi:hypothetical protein
VAGCGLTTGVEGGCDGGAFRLLVVLPRTVVLIASQSPVRHQSNNCRLESTGNRRVATNSGRV